jgi:hypothetical protein
MLEKESKVHIRRIHMVVEVRFHGTKSVYLLTF